MIYDFWTQGNTQMTLDISNPWIYSIDELPPCDGEYEIFTYHAVGKCYYDGYNFYFAEIPIDPQPKVWRYIKIKKYGKQTCQK
jgi:hypothetical protein